jgi:hypothetical protein
MLFLHDWLHHCSVRGLKKCTEIVYKDPGSVITGCLGSLSTNIGVCPLSDPCTFLSIESSELGDRCKNKRPRLILPPSAS